jgi:NitT/TauT family transport system substrate-binding protein
MKTSWIIAAAALICIVIIASLVLLASGGPEGNNTVSMGAVGKAGTSGLIYSYGVEKGIFDKYGLNVTYNRFSDVYTSVIAVLTGKVDTAAPSPGVACSAYADGEDVRIGMVTGLASNLMLIVKPGYTDVESLRGKRVGVMGTNSDSYQITKWYLKDKGLDLAEDVELIQIRSPANLLTSFKTDQLEAVVLFSGYAAEAIRSGGIAVTSITEAGEEVFGHKVYSSTLMLGEDFMERERVMKKFLRALREIAREIQENPDEAIEFHAAFAEEDPEKMRAVFEMVVLYCDLNQEIREDLIAFAEHGVSEGYFEKAFGDEVFYDEWR